MNDLYGNELYRMVNFFLPSFKLLDKQTMGSKIRKLHDKPKTPYQRLMESEHIDKKTKQDLTNIFKKLNSYKLQMRIRLKIRKI
jgi:hypothetical protein